MRLRFAAAVMGGLAFSAASADAQIFNVTATFGQGYLTSPGVTNNGYYVGPYSGTIALPGSSPTAVTFNCVDFFHDVVAGEQWTATLTNLGTGAGIGTTDANSTTRLYGNTTINSTVFSALDIYRTAAVLISGYATPASSDPAGTILIQDKVWEATSSFYPQTPGLSYYSTATTRTDGYSYNAPLTPAQLASTVTADKNLGGFNYSDWWVVTITGQTEKDLKSSPQEFLIRMPVTTTPEPGTLTLLGSGLAAVAGAGYRRRRKGSPTNAA